MEVQEQKDIIQRKKRNLFIVLSGIFLTNALLAEILGVKIFSAEKNTRNGTCSDRVIR